MRFSELLISGRGVRVDYSLSNIGKELYIRGAWRASSDAARFTVADPATEEILSEVADASCADALDAVEAAAAASFAWAARAPRERGEILRRAFELLIRHRDAFARLITLENGKTLTEARAEVTYAAEFLRWYSEEAVRIPGHLSTAPSGANRIIVTRQP